jgi:hypothetical protein
VTCGGGSGLRRLPVDIQALSSASRFLLDVGQIGQLMGPDLIADGPDRDQALPSAPTAPGEQGRRFATGDRARGDSAG